MKFGTGHFSDANHVETCRGRNCHAQLTRDKMVKASTLKDQPNARGWYCERCAAMIDNPQAEIARRRAAAIILKPGDLRP